MKKGLILYFSVALLFGSCKKVHNDKANAPNAWTFNGKTYQAATVVYTSYGNLTAATYGANCTLIFDFSAPPASSGEMLITDSGDPNTIKVSVGTSTFAVGSSLYVCGKTDVKANITVNGKISVSFPGSIWLHNYANYSDSARLSAGTITQQ